MVDEEQDKLSEALHHSDTILLASLKQDERRRRTRLFLAGVLAGLLLVGIVLLVIHNNASPSYSPSAAQLAELAKSLEQFRRVLVEYDLGFDSVFPQRKPAGRDPDRLNNYPGGNAWPRELGFVQPNPLKFQFMQEDKASAIVDPSSSGICLTSRQDHQLILNGYATVVCLEGVGNDGVIVAKSYASVIVKGHAAGRLVFNSYATLLIDGDLSGGITADVYFAAVITGKATGRLKLDNYAMVYILGGFDGQAELNNSTLFLGGRVTKEQLQRITGSGRVFVEESDLVNGKHQLGDITVHVGQRIDLRTTASAASSQP